LALVLLAAGAVTLPAQAGNCPGTTTAKGVRSVTLPQRPSIDTGAVQGFTVDPRDDKRYWVWTLNSLMLSEDAGCTWQQAYAASPPTADYTFDPILSVVPGVLPGTRSALLVTRTTNAIGQVLYSKDGRSGWAKATGLPPVGAVGSIAYSPFDPQLVYLTFTPYFTYYPRTYTSTDGGQSWQAVEDLASVVTAQAQILAPNPRKPGDLWASTNMYVIGANGTRYPALPLAHSTDGGKSWTSLGPTSIARILVVPTKAGIRVIALDDTHGILYRSDDDGKTFKELATPSPAVPQLAQGKGPDDTFVTSQTSAGTILYRLVGGKWKEFATGAHDGLMSTKTQLFWRRGDQLQSRKL